MPSFLSITSPVKSSLQMKLKVLKTLDKNVKSNLYFNGLSLVTITTLHHNINPLKVSTKLSTSVAAYEVNFNFDYQGQNIFSDPRCRLCDGSQWIAEHHWQWPGPVLHAAQVPVLGWAGADGVVCSGQCQQERWDEGERGCQKVSVGCRDLRDSWASAFRLLLWFWAKKSRAILDVDPIKGA